MFGFISPEKRLLNMNIYDAIMDQLTTQITDVEINYRNRFKNSGILNPAIWILKKIPVHPSTDLKALNSQNYLKGTSIERQLLLFSDSVYMSEFAYLDPIILSPSIPYTWYLDLERNPIIAWALFCPSIGNVELIPDYNLFNNKALSTLVVKGYILTVSWGKIPTITPDPFQRNTPSIRPTGGWSRTKFVELCHSKTPPTLTDRAMKYSLKVRWQSKWYSGDENVRFK
jgi:hypothetical protein